MNRWWWSAKVPMDTMDMDTFQAGPTEPPPILNYMGRLFALIYLFILNFLFSQCTHNQMPKRSEVNAIKFVIKMLKYSVTAVMVLRRIRSCF